MDVAHVLAFRRAATRHEPSNPAISDAEISASLETANAALPDYARVQRWLRLREPLSVSGGLLTENGRPKRMAIAKQFESLIDALYLEGTANNLSHEQRKESA